MSKDKLVIEESRSPYGFRIWWYLADEQEMGACIGEGKMWEQKKAPAHPEEWEAWTVETAIKSLDPSFDCQGFYFETITEARSALKVAKEALKQKRPLPEWAKTALKHGWKPPKGWKA